jgi:hypothetical protein
MKIVVLGYIVRGPLGGLVWHHFQYVYGLAQMGHEVLFLEDSEEYAACYNPETNELSEDPTFGISFLKEIFEKYGLNTNWAYFDFHTNSWFGKTKNEVKEFLSNADIVLNISGVNPLREWTSKIPKRVFIDTDPVFTQVRHLTDPDALNLARQHNVFFTFGENFGKPNCTIPDDGLNWKATRQPVAMELWENEVPLQNGNWTTVMQWDSYKTRQWNKQLYGMKSKSFDGFLNLPENTNEKFELALGSASAPKSKMENLGWSISDPVQITRTPQSYKDYILASKGEWSIAKHGYVISNSGWFSERSTAYLASSKPVVVQETGFSEIFNTGRGLFGFKKMEDLPDIFSEVNNNYTKHCSWAKEICSQYFNYNTVLKDLLDTI